MNKDVIISIHVYEHIQSPTQVKDPELSHRESDGPEITPAKDLKKAQGGDDTGLNQGKGYRHPDGRLEVSCRLDRKPSGSVMEGA